MTAQGRTFKGVGLCYAGNASYMASAGGLKRSFKIDLQAHRAIVVKRASRRQSPERCARPDQGPRGLGLRPLPRGGRSRAPDGFGRSDTHCSWSLREGVYLGLYTLVEPVDRAFLSHRFSHRQGPAFFKPQGLRGIDFLGDDWEKFRGQYQPQSEPTAAEATRLIEVRPPDSAATVTSVSRKRSPLTSTWISSCVSWPSRCC